MGKVANDLYKFIKGRNGKYINKYGGVVSKVQGEEPFGGQCVSLVTDWLAYEWGRPVKARGDAKNFVNLENSKIVPFNQRRNGDLIVYPNISKWGHIGICVDGKMFDQNPYKAGIHDIIKNQKVVIVRPNEMLKDIAESNNKSSVDKPLPNGFVKFSKPRKYVAKQNIVKRTSPNSVINTNVFGTWEKGVGLTCIGYVDTPGYRWLVYQNVKGQWTYVTEALLKYAKGGRPTYEQYFYCSDVTK